MLVKGHFECYLCDITQPQIMKKMKKLVENLLSWCKKSMKMRRCVGKSTAPVTGQSVGQTGNAEGVLPSTATETVDEIVLPAAVETAGMVETIDEKAAFGQ